MQSRDSLDAAAWLGSAHCHALDRAVVRSTTSKTGWAFRGSIAAAQRSYTRALQISPAAFSAFPFELVVRLFSVESNTYRSGTAPDSSPYFGLQDIVGDTLAYNARPFAELNGTPFEVLAPAYDRALQRNRDALLAILSALTQRLPDNPDAFESLARVLETRDEITGTPNGGYSALSALDRAKVLAKDSAQRARLGAADVRLHLKLGDFSRTVAIGDSVLNANPAPGPKAAEYLAGVAALLGREHAAAQYLRTAGFSVSLAGAPAVPLLEDVSTALFMRSALGACDDSLRALHKRVATLLESYVNSAQRTKVRRGMLMRPMQFSVGCLGAATTTELGDSVSSVMRAVEALGTADAKHSRFLLDSLQKSRKLLRPGELSLDHTITEAWLSATLGDTVAAIHQLDLSLTALPTLSPYVVYEPGMAAAVGRSMVYRADLAARRGDAVTAALWASRVITLWGHSDPSLAPTLLRMKALATHRT
jgi:tetratricopeptide (TPR) repeat protein